MPISDGAKLARRCRQVALQSDDGAQHARLARAGRADQAHELAGADVDGRAFEDRLAAIGNRQITDAQFQPPTIVVSCTDMLAPDLMRPPAIRLCSTRLAASRSMFTVSDRARRGDAR